MGARFEALIEGVLMAPLDSRYTQVGFNLISVQVCVVRTTDCKEGKIFQLVFSLHSGCVFLGDFPTILCNISWRSEKKRHYFSPLEPKLIAQKPKFSSIVITISISVLIRAKLLVHLRDAALLVTESESVAT